MLGIPIGLAASNAGEWFIHKYWLHGLGKDKTSFWAFHWHEHHRESRKNDMFDAQYIRSVFSWSPQGKEALALALGAVAMTPMFPVAPFFTGTVWYRMYRYYRIHKRAHLDREWAKTNLPWHYDHHMGKDQNANWCVTHPWFDHVMGTRKLYEYTAKGPSGESAPASRRKSFLGRAVDGLKEAWAVQKALRAEKKAEPRLRAA
ncbi:MAG: hypothetical protein MUC96_03535 [Myxococcaceae bacterium]|jgi:hypothetical protein|nr:hypothetical protein [Myxococcaceae bacterium]